MSLNYLNTQEILKNKTNVEATLSLEEASLVVKSGQAKNLILGYASKDARILDCGPGIGVFLRQIYEKGYQNLYAVDIDDYLSFRAIKELKSADLSFDKIPWPDSFFDVVCAWQMVEHLENPHHFMRKVNRVLKPNGVFILSMPNIQHIFNRIFFFRKGDMFRWHKKNNHIALFPKGLFQKTFLKYFNLVDKKFTQGEFPWRFLSKFKFPSNERFGRDVVYILRKRID